MTVTEDQPGDGSQADYVVVNRSEKEDYVVLGGTQVDDDEYDDDDDDDYSTEEEDIVFDKRIKFFSKDGDWKVFKKCKPRNVVGSFIFCILCNKTCNEKKLTDVQIFFNQQIRIGEQLQI